MTTLSFDHDSIKYSPNNALALAYCAKWAYLDAPMAKAEVSKQLQTSKFQFVDIKSSGTQAFVAGDSHKIIVSFRGTEPSKLQDILSDIKLVQVYHALGNVHGGFIRSLDSAWREIITIIRQFQDNNQTIWFTGHSLGAALATLGVAKMLESAYPVSGLYNFGQPRVGDKKFADTMNKEMAKRYFRFVNNNDVVPRVPPRVPLGYADCGYFMYLDKSQVLHDDLSIWKRLLDGVHGRIEALGEKGTDGINDHNMDAYIAGVAKNMNKLVN
jgi:triacylglycerol lipase